MTEEQNTVHRTRRRVSLLAMLSVVALVMATIGVTYFVVNTHDSTSELQQVTRSIQQNRARAIRAIAEETLVECSRNNSQDMIFLTLLNESVKSAGERGEPPLTERERKLLDSTRAGLRGRNCAAKPSVRNALREGVITRKAVRAILAREKQHPSGLLPREKRRPSDSSK